MPESYRGYEHGPVRPPNEAFSLLIRITRNCPWNRCTFCPIYKGTKFSLRPVEHVIQDIDSLHLCVTQIKEAMANDHADSLDNSHLDAAYEKIDSSLLPAFQAAAHWIYHGMRSIFLQDANSLVIKPANLTAILEHIKKCFPGVQRITSYARSHTVAGISDVNLLAIGRAGLNRIHIGMESACDSVLEKVAKGSTKANHIEAGLKVKKAGMELSEYVMPGLGGKEFWRSHAIDTADALNRINPHFIRLRSLAIPDGLPLFQQWERGEFVKGTELETVHEIRLFLETLTGITSTLKSDHILNLFQELEGTFPQDKAKMIGILDTFLQLPPEEQALYQLGRRMGAFMYLSDLQNPTVRPDVESAYAQLNANPQNIDQIIAELMKRFI